MDSGRNRTPIRHELIDHDIVYDYTFTLIVGSLADIRDWVYAHAPHRLQFTFRFTNDRDVPDSSRDVTSSAPLAQGFDECFSGETRSYFATYDRNGRGRGLRSEGSAHAHPGPRTADELSRQCQIKVGVDLAIGGALTHLSRRDGPNMINSPRRTGSIRRPMRRWRS